MTDDSYLLNSKDKKNKQSNWTGFFLKLVFFICAFVLIIITVLANMGGSNETLHDGVKQFISGFFGGKPVQMERLVYMGFFPTVAIDVEGVSVFADDKTPYPLITLGRLQASMPFWNVATSSPKLTKFYMEKFSSVKGALLPAELVIDKAFVDHDIEGNTAFLRGNGKIGVHNWTLSIQLEISGSKQKYNYMLAPESQVNFDIADISFETVLIRNTSEFLKFRDFKLKYQDREMRGTVVVSALGERLLKIKGDVRTGDDSTILLPDLVLNLVGHDSKDLSGIITSEALDISDFTGEDSVFSVFSRFREIFGYEAVPKSGDKLALLGSYNLQLALDLKNVSLASNQSTRDVKLDLVQDNGRLKVGPVSDNSGEIFPVLMMVSGDDYNAIYTVIQDGVVDPKFAQSWLSGISSAIVEENRMQVECGIGKFIGKDSKVIISDFALQTNSSGSVVMSGNEISKAEPLAQLRFDLYDTKSNLITVPLLKAEYDFVQGSLQKSTSGSPCASYISLIEEEVDPAVETPSQQDSE